MVEPSPSRDTPPHHKAVRWSGHGRWSGGHRPFEQLANSSLLGDQRCSWRRLTRSMACMASLASRSPTSELIRGTGACVSVSLQPSATAQCFGGDGGTSPLPVAVALPVHCLGGVLELHLPSQSQVVYSLLQAAIYHVVSSTGEEREGCQEQRGNLEGTENPRSNMTCTV